MPVKIHDDSGLKSASSILENGLKCQLKVEIDYKKLAKIVLKYTQILGKTAG